MKSIEEAVGLDEYGCFRATRESWDTISSFVGLGSPITFAYSADNYTAFVITLVPRPMQVGIMPFGGTTRGMTLVSLRGRGNEFFALHESSSELHPSYVAEKLDIAGSDAEVISELLNEIKTRLAKGAA